MSALAAFRPSPTAALAALFDLATEESLRNLAMSDGGWGFDETFAFLVGLRDHKRFEDAIDWQIKENLELATWVGRADSLRADAARPRDELIERALAAAVLVRASGEPVNQQVDFSGLEERVAQLLASALALGSPLPAHGASLLAWRLTQAEPVLGDAAPFLWLALLIAALLGPLDEINADVLADIARSALAAHDRSIADGWVGLLLEKQILADRWRFWLASIRGLPQVTGHVELADLVERIRSVARASVA